MTLLDRAADTSKRIASLLAETNIERNKGSDSKKIRDRVYTHLKEAVDEIYEHGQFAFRQDDERRRGYRSNYMHERRKRYEGKAPSPVSIPGKKEELTPNPRHQHKQNSEKWFYTGHSLLLYAFKFFYNFNFHACNITFIVKFKGNIVFIILVYPFIFFIGGVQSYQVFFNGGVYCKGSIFIKNF